MASRTDPPISDTIFRDIIEHSHGAILLARTDGTVFFANDASTRCFDREVNHLLGANALDIIGADRALLSAVTADTAAEITHESRVNHRNGRLVWLEWRLRLVRPQSGPAVLCVGEDITKRRYAEERYRVLFEESKDMIYACTPTGVLTEINPAGVELLGYSTASELIGRNIVEFYVSEQDRQYYNQRILDNGFVKDLELVMRRRDESEIFVLETSSAIRNAEGAIAELRGIVKDITDRIQSEKLQLQMNIKLSDANRKLRQTQSRLVQQEKLASIGQLAAGVAHEINNPLGFVKSNFGSLQRYIDQMLEYLQYLEVNIRRLVGEQGDYVVREQRSQMQLDFILEDIESIFDESAQGFDRIVAIVRGLRNFSRMDAAGRIAEYDLNSALDDALVMARNEIKYAAEVRKELGDIPPVECRADEINQVLLNVIVNAAQAIKEAQYQEKRAITVKTWNDDRWVVCQISDDGPGMSEEVRRRVFDPFFTTKDIGRGTGLGLSISYDIIVNRHGGDLSVQSSPGAGAVFTIKLPLGATEE